MGQYAVYEVADTMLVVAAHVDVMKRAEANRQGQLLQGSALLYQRPQSVGADGIGCGRYGRSHQLCRHRLLPGADAYLDEIGVAVPPFPELCAAGHHCPQL
ncbi:hypothetical protein C4B68_07120 [Streptomyces dengpaensis]|uniref:Uncharacterized protein n=1 Tax=Streptomyces dengpaensis TaxID=2049881 RepID=A0ABN5HXC1_9ACTN|nr:hypothetical protein C4B68_07120 [Streptomyces dengpaensis]PIB11852.1 hypothetical protein B1C81_01080 [Streptomyces sp. HG99]